MPYSLMTYFHVIGPIYSKLGGMKYIWCTIHGKSPTGIFKSLNMERWSSLNEWPGSSAMSVGRQRVGTPLTITSAESIFDSK